MHLRTKRSQSLFLAALFFVFLIGIYRCELVEQRYSAQEQPSTLAVSHPGAGALYALLQSLDFPVDRLTTPWNELGPSIGALVVLQPLSRNPAEDEIAPLHDWVAAGGTLLMVCAGQPQGEDADDSVAGDVSLVAADRTTSHAAPEPTSLSYTTGVRSVSVSSPLRLQPAANAHFDILVKDKQGIVAVHKLLGKGHVILVTDDLLATNAGIPQDDNAVFLVNVASAASRSAGHKPVAFDEYHHGLGFQVTKNAGLGALWSHLPARCDGV